MSVLTLAHVVTHLRSFANHGSGTDTAGQRGRVHSVLPPVPEGQRGLEVQRGVGLAGVHPRPTGVLSRRHPGSDAFITLSVTGDCSYFSCMHTEGRGPGDRSRALPIGVGSVEDMFHLSRLVDHVYTTRS